MYTIQYFILMPTGDNESDNAIEITFNHVPTLF